MAHPNEDLVREGFAAFSRGDMDYLQKQFFAGDVRYHLAGSFPAGCLVQWPVTDVTPLINGVIGHNGQPAW